MRLPWQRPTFKSRVLSTPERAEAAELIEQHLRMYLPPDLAALLATPLFTTRDATDLQPPVSKQPVLTGPPSPKSLGDMVDEASPTLETTMADLDATTATLDCDGEGDAAMAGEAAGPVPSQLGPRGDVTMEDLTSAHDERLPKAQAVAGTLRETEDDGDEEVLLVAWPGQTAVVAV